MSAPRTPAEMADWLAHRITPMLMRPEDDSAETDAIWRSILDYLRRQPTDAQKIEALKLASVAGFTLSGKFPPEALRLLGLPTE